MDRHWLVYTPEFMTYGDPWSLDPPEYGSDVVTVSAPTKRKALVESVRKMRKEGMPWVQDQQSDRASPFTGLKAELQTCEHGNCNCDLRECQNTRGYDLCPQCVEIWDKEAEGV